MKLLRYRDIPEVPAATPLLLRCSGLPHTLRSEHRGLFLDSAAPPSCCCRSPEGNGIHSAAMLLLLLLLLQRLMPDPLVHTAPTS